jgi:A/G-specific adenine glycosylase
MVERGAAEDLVLALRGWYFTRRRQLPWRDDPTPYRVWVSEIMLQQTQVVTVLPYFERFMSAFPMVEALADAPEEAVMAQWAGLGYYRRARNLHLAAKRVAERGGVFPNTVDGLLELPGIGRYTAGAIASIAFGVKAPLLDGNVARVLSRVFSMDDPSSHNQALMELGALVCSPRSPACSECPLADSCRALATGRQAELPVKARRVAPQPVAAVCGLWRDGELALFAQRPDGLLGGLWELPGAELEGPVPSEDLEAELGPSIEKAFAERVGVVVEARRLIANVEHQFTHRSLTLSVVEVAGRAAPATVPDKSAHYPRLAWRPLAEPELPLSTLTRKVIKAIGRAPRRTREERDA